MRELGSIHTIRLKRLKNEWHSLTCSRQKERIFDLHTAKRTDAEARIRTTDFDLTKDTLYP